MRRVNPHCFFRTMSRTRASPRRQQQGSGGGGIRDGGIRRHGIPRRRQLAWGVLAAAGVVASASPLARCAFRVAAAASLIQRCVPWAITASRAIEWLLEPDIAAEVWLIARGLPEAIATGFRNSLDANRWRPAARTRVDSAAAGRASAAAAPLSEDAQRLVRGAIAEELDGECGICTRKLTHDNLAIMSCCVPEAVGGRVHVVCAGCWARLPEPKKCPHCRRRVRRCAPLEMVRMIRAPDV